MVIDTVILKASYDLMHEKAAFDFAIRKFAKDVERGSELQTVKMARFVDTDGYDHLKFNFPVCGNLSSADLMVIYCAMAGFDTVVVGNAERGRRDALIRRTLGLDNILSVPELDCPVEQDAGHAARDALTFTNTQERGFRALSVGKRHDLILEVAADQPLMYDVPRHAVDLSREDIDFAMNLNAVSLMKSSVPSFIRNGYDRVVNSKGEVVDIKENNNFAQNWRSMEHNRPFFKFVYENRNGGRYFNFSHIARSLGFTGAVGRLGRFMVESFKTPQDGVALIDELEDYASHRKTKSKAAPYAVLRAMFNTIMSPSFFRRRAHVDATNDDIFACWDMDGLNNDYLGYRALFDRNLADLNRIMPFAEQVYQVNDALDREGPGNGMMVQSLFDSKYIHFARGIMWRLRNKDYLSKLGIPDDSVDAVSESGVVDVLFDRAPPNHGMITDLEKHLAEHCKPKYEENRDKYEHMKAA